MLHVQRTVWTTCLSITIFAAPLSAQDSSEQERAKLDFFESKIRPALIEHCQECHALDSEQAGGLLLDSQAGWQKGGDQGPAIVPGKSSESLLLKAISYSNPKLQMPPDGKLPADVIENFRQWIDSGAIDPRTAEHDSSKPKSRGLTVEEAQSHWSYRPVQSSLLINVAGSNEHKSSSSSAWIDAQINAKLSESEIEPATRAAPEVLIRRLYLDLTGLPPTVSQLKEWTEGFDATRYTQLVDHLLGSPHFGEAFARRWMDVIRYGDSVTLRGFVLPQSWRYRDYLINAYNEDRSFQQMICEQIAGDLMTADDPDARSQQLIATTFLTLGNTNLEKQDKDQLDMDYLDEQLDVIGAAFLGQTLGCARCHDHKFDPIPTRDYYALAGILKSSTGLKHSNVSEWIEKPLPLDPDNQTKFGELESQHTKIAADVKELKKKLDALAKANPRFIKTDELPGVVVDSAQATLVGKWVESTHVGNIVGESYIHDDNTEKGMKSATFEPQNLPPGEYEVLLAYQASENRATNVVVQVFSADGEKEVTVNERQQAPELNLWRSLGRYRFEEKGQKFVLISNANTDGHVILDAVLFLPVAQMKDGSLSAALQVSKSGSGSGTDAEKQKATLKTLEKEAAELQKQLDERPKYMTVVENSPPKDLAIHIRGDVHTLGEVVPRGFLAAVSMSSKTRADAKPTTESPSPTRKELAEWVCSNENPLTARVYANRIWTWLMGRGIVATPNNFGTTGSAPTHPELLDNLATRLIQSNWSTKAIVREIVLSQAYQRRFVAPGSVASDVDPDNLLYWRGHTRRMSVEALRDSMLLVSGELDYSRGGSLIQPGTKADYNYTHRTTRRSIYHPVFRNSLPELFDEFDFADSSVSIEARSRSTVSQQGLSLMQEPWVIARARQASLKYASTFKSQGVDEGLTELYLACFSREPSNEELKVCRSFLGLDSAVNEESNESSSVENKRTSSANPKTSQINDETVIDPKRLELLIQSLFASIDFRFLE